jgi:hypothetical protein
MGSGAIYPLVILLLGKNPQYPLNRSLGGTQSQSKHPGEKEISDPATNWTLILYSSNPCPSHYTNWAVPVPIVKS